MDQTEIDDIVSEWVNKGVHISQETVDYVLWYCERKMDVNGIENRKEYLPLLFRDELKNYLFRQAVNATTLLREAERKCAECAACVSAFLATPDVLMLRSRYRYTGAVNAGKGFMRATSILTAREVIFARNVWMI